MLPKINNSALDPDLQKYVDLRIRIQQQNIETKIDENFRSQPKSETLKKEFFFSLNPFSAWFISIKIREKKQN